MSVESGVAQHEAIRKLVHIAFGLVAYSLRWLTYPQALLLASAAIVFNLFILPRVGGKLIARAESGRDTGIILYPIAVLILIALFRGPYVHIAAVSWCALAFGDGFASLIGRTYGSQKLPWNRDKSILGLAAFLVAAIPTVYAAILLMPPQLSALPIFLIAVVASTVAAVVETLPTNIDDNLTVPFTMSIAVIWLERWNALQIDDIQGDWLFWMIANFALATLGYAARAVSVSGWIGGMIVGGIIILFGGWPLYVVLVAFFFVGSAVTKLGYAKKARLGLAQEEGGRRGFSHAFANAGFATLCALSVALTVINPALLWFLAIASFATAAADTTSSEVGQWLGRRTFMPLSFRRVEPGTEGAVSLEGTIGGIVGAAIVAAVGVCALVFREGKNVVPVDQGWLQLQSVFATPAWWSMFAAIVGGAFVGSYLESVIGSSNSRRQKPISGGVLNFLNTAVGAVAATIIAVVLGVRF